MQDFENIDTWGDEDGIEITDLEPQSEGFRASLPLSFLRKIHFPAHTRARLMTIPMLLGAIVLVLLIQPPSLSVPGQASSNHVLTTPSSQHFIVVSTVKVYTASEIIWFNSSGGSIVVSQASDGTMQWHHCGLQKQLFAPLRIIRKEILACW
jgi:hypothetical protein